MQRHSLWRGLSLLLALVALPGCQPKQTNVQEVQAFDRTDPRDPPPETGGFLDPETLPGVMCARVVNGAGAVQRAFCAPGKLGQMCRGDHSRTCEQEGQGDPASSTGRRLIWYQAAIDWAKAWNHPRVLLDPGIITITADTAQKLGHPYDLAGIHVPPGIHLEGSHDYGQAPSIINVGSQTKLDALVVVADPSSLEHAVISDAGVSYLTLSGSALPYYGAGEACPASGHNLTSILQLDGHEPGLSNFTWNFIQSDNRKDTAGIRILASTDSTATPVNVHHVKISHVALGIAYGWNTPVTPEDSSCVTRLGIRLRLTPAVNDSCPDGVKKLWLSLRPGAQESRPASCSTPIPPPPAATGIAPRAFCMVPEPGEASPHYCNVQPYEFHGNPNARSQIHNNSICDVRVGINVVGGNVDVTKNVVLRHPTNESNYFGLSTDGHMPYTQFTTHSENFVSGFSLGFLTDGSQYIMMDDCAFRQLTGYAKEDFASAQDFLDLAQYAVDDAQKQRWMTDPTRGFIDHVYVRDNRFYKNVRGLSLYRVNWGFVGFNTIDGANAASAADIGVLVDNTINSWVYGNTIRDYNHAIHIRGSPGQQSQLGSCHNGIHTYCSGPGCPVWASYPNVFSGSGLDGGQIPCNVVHEGRYCGAPSAQTPPEGVQVCYDN
jgi:hypothetical protein